MKDCHINVFYSDEDGGYIADIPDLEACSAFGRTLEEPPAPAVAATTTRATEVFYHRTLHGAAGAKPHLGR